MNCALVLPWAALVSPLPPNDFLRPYVDTAAFQFPAWLLIVAGLTGLIALAAARGSTRLWLGATLLCCAAGLAVAMFVLVGAADWPDPPQDAAWTWSPAFEICGERVALRLDALSAFFLALTAVVGGVGAVYGNEYWAERAHPRSARAGRFWWSVLLLTLGLVLVAANGLHFLIGWELFTLAAYFLVTLDRRRAEVRAAGWLYLGASHVAMLALFAFFALLAEHNGDWSLGPMREHAELAPLFWLALVGFGLKAGLFPLHVWLPSAHANAPSHVSAILSGVTIKIGLYGLIRFSGWLPVPAGAGWVVVTLGAASAVLGVAFALGQHDLKRLLAYHSVENIGIILLGFGFALVAADAGHPEWGALALAGGLLHVWNHGLFKALLFLGAGSVLHATGTREMSRLGGLWRTMPWTTSLFALGAVAICGLPPLNGFVSEWLVYLGLFDATLSHAPAAWGAIPAAIALAVTGALALACFSKVCGVVFLGAPRSAAAERAHEAGPAMRGAMLVLAVLCVAIGLAPVLFWPAVARAVEAWNPAWSAAAAPAAPLRTLMWCQLALAATGAAGGVWLWRRSREGLRRALTWDCGYRVPTARMQYTAGSFAATIVEWFDWILRPVRHEHRPEETLPAAALVESHTPETVLERCVEPAARAVLRVSAAVRRLQHGRMQAYVLYLVLGVAALAFLVLVG
ncbi:MAG TPA: proton-conducting transporter membrane subunit [Opitutaceae bacterium]|nr:proton-conducting transporter membrane subunit [Opitutaceae bacterium]